MTNAVFQTKFPRCANWSTRGAVEEGNYCYNAATGVYTDMIEAGIPDPTKVVRSALQNAASVAGLMITTEAMVAELPKENAPMGAPDMGGMM